jgi:hypothetical protein
LLRDIFARARNRIRKPCSTESAFCHTKKHEKKVDT